MLDFARNAAFWAALGAMLAALGVEIPQALVTHILELLAILSGLIGIIRSLREAGYQVKKEATPPAA